MSAAVRIAEQRDVARLEAIENAADSILVEFLGATQWKSAPSGEDRASVPGFLLVIGEPANENAIGFAHIVEEDGEAHLEQLSVLPDHARHGLGRSLVTAAKAEASRRGYGSITLRTYADVPWNAPFYASCGFVESEPETAFHRRLVDAELGLGLEAYGRRVQMVAQTDSD